MLILVAGTGRSGTRSVIRQLADVGLDCKHEPSGPLVRMVAGYWPAGGLSDAGALGVLKRVRWARDANSFWLFPTMLPLLDQLWPDARWVWAVRNAPDTVASMLHMGWFDPCRDDDPPVTFMWPDGDSVHTNCTLSPTGASLGDMTVQEWRALPQAGRCAWWWGWVYARMRDRPATRYPIESQRPDLLFDALGIEARPKHAWCANRSGDEWPTLPGCAQLWINRFCSEGMDELYGSWEGTRHPKGRWVDQL